MADHLVQAGLTLALWFTLWGSWRFLSRYGERLGWWMARWQLDRLEQQARLRQLQMHLELLRLGTVHNSPLMVAAAMEAERERREW